MLRPAKGAYTDDFAYEPTTPGERRVACAIAGFFTAWLAIVAALPRSLEGAVAAATPGTVPLPGFVPAVASVVVTAAVLTAWLFYSQYRVRRHAPLAILACAYGLLGVLKAAYLLAFPGAFISARVAAGHPQSAAWLGAFAHLGFAALAILLACVERSRRRSARWHAGIVARSALATLGFAAFVAVATTLGSGWLPALVTDTGSFTPVETNLVAPLDAMALFAAALTVIGLCGVSRRIHLWFAIALFAMGLETIAGVAFGGRRFSTGWYSAQLGSIVSAMLFFGVMQSQLTAILRRAARNAERSLALHDIVSLGNETSADRNAAMLERAAIELDFDWACLGQIERGWVTLERSIGDAPYGVGYRAPIGAAWFRDALKRRDISVSETDVDLPWVDEAPIAPCTWSTFVTVPLFVDGELYGLAGFANVRRRRHPLTPADRQFLQLLGSLAGVTIERTRQRRQLSRLAYTDALTGLANRAALFEHLHKEVALSERYDRQFALHFLDLDGFKAINDAHGHAAGDEVLREVGRRLQSVVRESDTVARLGGDEFVVLQPQIEDSKAPERLVARLKEAFTLPISYGDDFFKIRASIGTSRFPRDGREIHALLDRADEALYRMKARRRAPAEPSRVTVFRPRSSA